MKNTVFYTHGDNAKTLHNNNNNNNYWLIKNDFSLWYALNMDASSVAMETSGSAK